MPTFVESTRLKETLALMRFGRDSAWPLRITAASYLDEETSLSISYVSDLDGCDGTIEWVQAKFKAAAEADQIALPPAFQRQDATWDFSPRKENNSFHVLIRENTTTEIPEDPGLPAVVLYGPEVIIKLRRQTPDTSKMLHVLDICIASLYQGRPRITEHLSTNERAIIGSLANFTVSGLI
jgi:hypothetical protein